MAGGRRQRGSVGNAKTRLTRGSRIRCPRLGTAETPVRYASETYDDSVPEKLVRRSTLDFEHLV